MDVIKGKSPSKEFLCQAQDKIDERPSSPNDCAICLEQLTDKSFTNSCLHMFCFHCLLAWSKVKPECPLCKQDFCSIIHNIRSMTDYDEYHVPPPEARLSMYLNSDPTPPDLFTPNNDFFSNHRQFFSYRTTFMSNGFAVPRVRTSNLVIRPYVDTNLEIQTDFPLFDSSQQSQSRFTRREVYLKELETVPPPSGGRYRECSPEFYRENEGQIHRLARWLQREFTALTQIGVRFDPHLLLRLIMDMLPVYSINSTVFHNMVNRYLRPYTSRFIREFSNFAVSPYEMDRYDRECVYVRQRNGGSNSQFIVSMNGDDTEDIQVIPNPTTECSPQPWIDVNDLNTAHHHPFSSGVYSPSRPPRNSFFSTSRPLTTTSLPASQTVIDISDSENDDCVIIEEARTVPETIVLDDSDHESQAGGSEPRSTQVKHRSSSTVRPLDLSRARTYPPSSDSVSLPSTSCQCANSGTTSTGPFCASAMSCKLESEPDVTVEYQSRTSSSQPVDRQSPARGSSVLSTAISSDESGGTYLATRSKKKHSRRFYRMKHSKKRENSYRCASESSDECAAFLTDSSSIPSDKNDEDWEECRYKRKKKTKKVEKKISGKRRRRTSTTSKSVKKKKTVTLDVVDADGEVKRVKKSKTTKKKLYEDSSPGPSHYVKKPCLESADGTNRIAVSRLRSVVRKVQNNEAAIDRRQDQGDVRRAHELDNASDRPSTSCGFYGYHEDKSNGLGFLRNYYSSDSD